MDGEGVEGVRCGCVCSCLPAYSVFSGKATAGDQGRRQAASLPCPLS